MESSSSNYYFWPGSKNWIMFWWLCNAHTFSNGYKHVLSLNLLDYEEGSGLWYRLLFEKHAASQEDNLAELKDELALLNVFYSCKYQFGAKLTTGPSFRFLPKFLSKAPDHVEFRIMQLPISESRPPPTTEELRYRRMLRNHLARNLFALRRIKSWRDIERAEPHSGHCIWWSVGEDTSSAFVSSWFNKFYRPLRF